MTLEQKVMTVRIATDLAEALDRVARGDGVNTSDAIREAIAAYVEAKRNDPDFQARLRARIEADIAIMEGLAQ